MSITEPSLLVHCVPLQLFSRLCLIIYRLWFQDQYVKYFAANSSSLSMYLLQRAYLNFLKENVMLIVAKFLGVSLANMLIISFLFVLPKKILKVLIFLYWMALIESERIQSHIFRIYLVFALKMYNILGSLAFFTSWDWILVDSLHDLV